jgi:rSAM/selenodomain-associated transferase 2
VRPTLAIVIPTLDEEGPLRTLLPVVVGLAEEVVVSDGGSRDATLEVAAEWSVTTVTGPAGRGRQLNRGAAACSAEILLFLHADTSLPPGAPELVREALATGADGGGFLLAFDDRRLVLRIAARMIALRTRLTRAPLGDQAQFVSRRCFEELGGYRPWPILEDLDFALRLRRRGRLAVIPYPVVSAARRYLRGGVLRTAATNWLIWTLYFAGAPPQRLARFYRHIR